MREKNKGITLIALVITIIVLIILAGVSIAMLTGENGILTQAINAGDESKKAEEEEKLRLALIEYKAQKYTDNKDLKEFLESHKDILSVEGDTAPYTVIVDEYQVEIDVNGEYVENDFQLAGPRPKVENIKVTIDGIIEPTNGSLEEGTTLQINFDTSIESGTIKSISPQLPYTTNGTDKEIEFTIIGTVNGVDYTITRKISVENKYRELSEIEKAALTSEIEVFSTMENREIRDEYNNKIMIPAGFGIASDSGVNVTEGIVIEDADNGNQFVWIPVGDINNNGTNVNIQLSRYKFDADGDETAIGLQESVNNYGYAEEQIGTKGNAVAKDLGEFISKTEASGGYYIARYEASNNNGVVESKGNKEVWGNISQLEASTKSKEMYKNEVTFASDLVNSLAWDTALVCIQKFTEYTNYSKQGSANELRENTGLSEDQKLKIYDMASNIYELSTETYRDSNDSAVIRGGYYRITTSKTDFRDHRDANYSSNDITFRAILYL